jgi:hypothetical protein
MDRLDNRIGRGGQKSTRITRARMSGRKNVKFGGKLFANPLGDGKPHRSAAQRTNETLNCGDRPAVFAS